MTWRSGMTEPGQKRTRKLLSIWSLGWLEVGSPGSLLSLVSLHSSPYTFRHERGSDEQREAETSGTEGGRNVERRVVTVRSLLSCLASSPSISPPLLTWPTGRRSEAWSDEAKHETRQDRRRPYRREWIKGRLTVYWRIILWVQPPVKEGPTFPFLSCSWD